jgi:hypothetical protein
VIITKPQPIKETAIRTGKISKKEGKLLESKNGTMKSWLVMKKKLHLSSIQEEEDDPVSMMEVDKKVDTGREQRRAEARAMQRGWQARVICGMLVREICSGVTQKAVVSSWIDNMLECVWIEAQARGAWRMMMDSQQIQMRVLGMIEE